MNPIKHFLITSLFALLVSGVSFSQSSSSDGEKFVQFFITGMQSWEDAKKIDEYIGKQESMLTSRADYNTQGYFGIFLANSGIDENTFKRWMKTNGFKLKNYREGIYGVDKIIQPDMVGYEINIQSEGKSKSIIELPGDFPKYTNTGNPQSDRDRYKTAKEQWITDNPGKYQELLNEGTNKVQEIPYEEFIKFPTVKQQHIKEHPDQYKIVKQK